jgi:hypothetical protein
LDPWKKLELACSCTVQNHDTKLWCCRRRVSPSLDSSICTQPSFCHHAWSYCGPSTYKDSEILTTISFTISVQITTRLQ